MKGDKMAKIGKMAMKIVKPVVLTVVGYAILNTAAWAGMKKVASDEFRKARGRYNFYNTTYAMNLRFVYQSDSKRYKLYEYDVDKIEDQPYVLASKIENNTACHMMFDAEETYDKINSMKGWWIALPKATGILK